MRALTDTLRNELEQAAGAPFAGPDTIAPLSTDHVSAVMKIAAREQLIVRTQGGATKLGWSNPVDADITISTANLAGIREHIWQDLTCTVGAGTTWAVLEEHLAEHHQRVALDAFAPQSATVGGILATNDSGLLRLKYGSLRDLVLGVTIVLADGTIARSGGKVVKNVAGYDLPKLLIGSFGTLGIITEASFRLHPQPINAASFTLRSHDALALADVMKAALAQQLAVERMQMRNESTAFALDIELASNDSVLAEHTQRLLALAGDIAMEPAAPQVWQIRDEILATRGEASILKITALPAKLAAILAGLAQLAQQPDHSIRAVVDPVGIITLVCEAPPETTVAIVEDLRARLRSSGGNVVVVRRGWLPELIDTGHRAASHRRHACRQKRV
ncbi:FAD-binding oxidoreductase [Granulicella cerasi]|uniref:FAD-binding oxidoreductase n=1 Tax=Granulicella cerasi TaxID=741063 RepID=A0ABW1Z5A9_9BACT